MPTLPTHATDILKVVRASDVSKSETISMYQLYKWISEYRMKIILQKLGRGIYDDQWTQFLNCLELEPVDRAECPTALIESGCSILRTVQEIPKFIQINFVGTIDGKPYQMITPQRYYYISCKPYSGHDTFAYRKGKYIYIMNNLPLKYISLAGIAEYPEEVSNIQNGCLNSTCYNIDTEEYPIDGDTFSTVRQLILEKELKIMVVMPSDKDNDNQNILTPNRTITNDRL